MKVLLINNFFFRKGGSEAVFFNTADLLRKSGHEVVFFSYADEMNIHTGDHEYFINRGGAIERLKSLFCNRDAARKLDEVLTKEKPDIAHAHLFWGGISPSIFKVLHKHNIPIVHTAHDYRMVCPAYLLTDGKGLFCERCKGGKFYQCALHRCSKGNVVESMLMSMEMYYRNRKWHPAKELDGIIFVSSFSKQKHLTFDKQFEKARTTVLYNCPGEQVKESFNAKQDTYDSYYLFYGRLSAEKGVPTLINAFEKFSQLKLRIVGTGPLEDAMKAYCKEKQMSNVEFLGYKTGKELFDLVAGAKFVCVPSECYENNPMTIVEAYTLGIPVIGTQIGGIPEIVEDGKTGFLFKSGNVISLENTIKRSISLTSEKYVSLKCNALQFADEHFSSKVYLERMVQFYQNVMSEFNNN